MLQRDYVLEIIGQFVEGVSRALSRAAAGEKDGLVETEREIGELLELDHATALALAPDSLVTMMVRRRLRLLRAGAPLPPLRGRRRR